MNNKFIQSTKKIAYLSFSISIVFGISWNATAQAELIDLSNVTNQPINQSINQSLERPLQTALKTKSSQQKPQIIEIDIVKYLNTSKSYYDFGQGSSTSQYNLFSSPNSINQSSPSGTSTLNTQTVNFTDQYQNQAIAQWSLQHLNGSMKQVSDLWVQDTLHQFTNNLNAQVRQQALYAVAIIDSKSINAFAIPGGVIGINAGTVMSSTSMDEVASVMAHEVAHISQRHYEHGKDNKKKSLLIQAAGFLAAAVAASASEGGTATAILAGSSSMAKDSAMSFSRANEREADRIGMQIMSQAGYDVHAMSKFFATLNKQSQINRSRYSFIPSYVRSHPMSAERMSEASSRASQYPKVSLKKRQQHQQTFDLLKWRLKVLTNNTNEANLKSASKNSLGAKFALVHWYGENQRWSNARELLTDIQSDIQSENGTNNANQHGKAESSSENVPQLQQLYAISEAKLASDMGNHQQAVDILTTQQKVYPERRDLRLYLAYELIDTDSHSNAQKALTILQPMSNNNNNGSSNNHSKDRQVWQGMRLANEVIARKSTDASLKKIATINALRYRAYDELWNASYNKALVSLTQAKTEVKKSKTTASRALLAMINQEINMVKEAQDFDI